jgi:hypothetical protein
MIEPSQLGWMACALDMHGHVIQKRNKERASHTHQVVVMVESVNLPAVNRLCVMTGQQAEAKVATPLPEAWSRRGCIEHCPDAHIHLVDEKPLRRRSRWTVTGASAAIILHGVQPYLTSWDEKYADAYHLIMGEVALSGRGSGMTRAGARRLMGLGWELPPGWLDDLLTPAKEDGNITEATAAIAALAGMKAIGA